VKAWEEAPGWPGSPNISITLDRCGHLMPDNEAAARDLLDAYLDAHGG
jgi:hypothetical protein